MQSGLSVIVRREGSASGGGRWLSVVLVLLLGAFGVSCGEFASADEAGGAVDESRSPAPGEPSYSDGDGVGGDGDADGDGSSLEEDAADSGAATAPPTEEEDVRLKLNPPTAAGRYVYVMDTALGVVARIDSESLSVRPIRVGNEPTILRANPDRNFAIVLNSRDSTVSLIDSFLDEDRVRTTEVLRHANSMELSRDGEWAAAWYDNRSAVSGDRIGSLQEVSLVRTADATSFQLSTGFAPRAVRFDATGSRAIVVSRGGINILDLDSLDGDTILPLVTVDSESPFEFEPEQVLLDPQGRFALIRRTDGTSSLYRVDLADRSVQRLDLHSPPTDVRLVENGQTALVALRLVGEVLSVPMGTAFEDPESVTRLEVDGAPVGRIEPVGDGSTVLLYTTLGGDRRVGITPLADPVSTRVVQLRKAISNVTSTPTADRAIVLHPREAVEEGSTNAERALLTSDAVSILDVTSGYGRLVLLGQEPDSVVWSSDGQHAFLLLARVSPPSVEWVELESMRTRTLTFDRQPETIGAVPATNRIFVTLESEAGRIIFIDPTTGEQFTIASYALNAFIE